MTTKIFDKPIFILGLPRSGTSMIAGTLKKAGAWAGTTIAATPQNPKGFFEHAQIREQVVKKTLIELDCDPLGVRRLPPLDATLPRESLRNTIFELLRMDGYRGDRPWLYKDAKLTLLWPMFLHAFPAARWVYVQRDLESFIKSCLHTSFMQQHSSDEKFWASFAESYLKRIQLLEEELKKRDAEFYKISTPPIVAGDLRELHTLVDALNLNYDEKKINKFIDPNHWHGK